MLSVEEIREQMKDRKVAMVAKRTGLNAGTIYNLMKDRMANPKASTLRALTEYLNGSQNGC